MENRRCRLLAQHVRRPQTTVFVQSEGLVTACPDEVCLVCLKVIFFFVARGHVAGWEVALELLREVWLEGGSLTVVIEVSAAGITN